MNHSLLFKKTFRTSRCFLFLKKNHSVVTERVKKSHKKKLCGSGRNSKGLESPELQMNRTSSIHSLTPVAIETLRAVVIRGVKGLAN